MVTYSYNADTRKYHFDGLAADTKPTKTDIPDLTNGSEFFEMDTPDTKYYDAENDQWV